MDERKIESLDEAIDELLSLGYLRYVEPEGCSVEVIGNIHDNPELVKGKEVS